MIITMIRRWILEMECRWLIRQLQVDDLRQIVAAMRQSHRRVFTTRFADDANILGQH